MGGSHVNLLLHICLGLTCLVRPAVLLQQARPPAPRPLRPPPSPPRPSHPEAPAGYADVCNPINLTDQAYVLLLFFFATGGPDWTVNAGWPTLQEIQTILNSDDFDVPLTCSRTLDGFTYQGLPAFCCWFGVSCCLSEACGVHHELLVYNCNCTVGAVTGLTLPSNNLTGSLDGSTYSRPTQLLANISTVEILAYLSCNLRGLGLQHNQLGGGIPDAVTLLSQLQELNLGYNYLTGRLPRSLGYMTSFNILELTGNQLSGPIPSGLCLADGSSPLTDLFLANNMFTGTLDVSHCRNLILIDASNNRLHGDIPSISGFPILHIVHLGGNHFSGSIPDNSSPLLFTGNLVTDLNLGNNRLTGPVPESIAELIYLTSLDLQLNSLTGTLPSSLFSNLGTLTSIAINNNMIRGTIPSSIGQASALLSLVLAQTQMTGTVPDSIVPVLGEPRKLVALRYSYFSCCGQDFNRSTMSYTWFNYSMPPLPAGLSLSTSMRFVSFVQNNVQGLSCPYLYRTDSVDIQDNLLAWDIDPQYYLFKNCTCQRGYVFTNLSVNGEPDVTCVLPPESSEPWWASMPYIWGVIALLPALLLMALTWHCVFRRGSRPVVIQNIVNMRKRMRGPPQPGDQISIVVTDIQGFSDLMRRSPQLTTEALMMHNLLIRKTKWANFGFTIEQEGDSYSILFHDAADAVKFCLQAQQSLAKQKWPEGLFVLDASGSGEASETMARHKSGGARFLSGLVHRISKAKRQSVAEGPKRSDVAASIQSLFSRDMFSESAAKKLQSGCESQVDVALTQVDVVHDPPAGSRNASDIMAAHPRSSQEIARGVQEDGLERGPTSRRSSCDANEHPKAPFFAAGGYGKARPLPAGQTGTLQGLRVRMGIATGILSRSTAAAASSVMESAKVISDAAAGGQVLMCSSTFQAVQHLSEELGCVDDTGLNLARFNAQRAPWWILGTKRNQEKQEAVLLDMGHYVQCSKGSEVPLVLSPRYLAAHACSGGRADARTGGNAVLNAGNATRSALEQAISGVEHACCDVAATAAAATAAPAPAPAAASVSKEPAQLCLQLYQILASTLVARGRVFGSCLALKEEWTPLDIPYFSAPGVMYAPVGPTDVTMAGLDLPPVTVVFCLVDGGKAYAARNRLDAQATHLALQAVVRSILRQIPGSYFVKEQDGEMKFLLVFQHPAAALMWCLAVQECAMYVEWPVSALRQWPEETDGSQLLFRGPRLKMGVCEGSPRSILPDYMGRADYCGHSVNQAARFMDAAAHGGQIACEESLFQSLSSFWNPTEPERSVRGSMSSTLQAPTLSMPQATSAAASTEAPPEDLPSEPSSRILSAPDLPARQVQFAVTQAQEERRPKCSGRAGGWPGYGAGAASAKSANGHGFGQLEPLMELDEGAEAATHLPPCLDSGPTNGDMGSVAAAPTPAQLAQRRGPLLGCLDATAERMADYSANMVPGAQMDAVAVHLGLFSFKGSPEPISMVSVMPAQLSGRRFPLDPPKGKGARLSEGSGGMSRASVPVLTVVEAYRKQLEVLRVRRAPALRARSLQQSPTASGSPTGLFQRSLSSARELQERGLSLLRRPEAGAEDAAQRPATPAPSSGAGAGAGL